MNLAKMNVPILAVDLNAKNYFSRNQMLKKTYSKQSSLPRLPIPNLNDTLEKFLTTVEPLLTRESFEKTQQEVSEFLSNDGPVLQDLLVAYDEEGRETGTHGSYIEVRGHYSMFCTFSLNFAFYIYSRVHNPSLGFLE